MICAVIVRCHKGQSLYEMRFNNYRVPLYKIEFLLGHQVKKEVSALFSLSCEWLFYYELFSAININPPVICWHGNFDSYRTGHRVWIQGVNRVHVNLLTPRHSDMVKNTAALDRMLFTPKSHLAFMTLRPGELLWGA